MSNIKIDLDTVISHEKGVGIRNESFGAVVVSRGMPAMCLNKDAFFLFDLCREKSKVRSLVKQVADRYAVEPRDVGHRVCEILAWLISAKILKIYQD